MVKHNNVVPNGHFRKHWQNYVKTWFNQPARKTRRRIARQKKAVKIFPRPTAGPLRPIVHGQTLKYNMKVRAGRGFSLEELKAGDSTPEELATATQVSGPYLPIVREKPTVELVKVTEDMKSFKAYNKLRLERTNERHVGVRAKRAAEAEKEEKK
ncbi:UNVERIFIED_CONTAM: 60S ribosomal protein L13-1 [Sesamum radiatum]|uniref:60S ribosomal protein L13-1 n=1 Tax=Sesamum radiatum TaxID=300843 RepID=A0AAW2NDD0_SESRA